MAEILLLDTNFYVSIPQTPWRLPCLEVPRSIILSLGIQMTLYLYPFDARAKPNPYCPYAEISTKHYLKDYNFQISYAHPEQVYFCDTGLIDPYNSPFVSNKNPFPMIDPDFDILSLFHPQKSSRSSEFIAFPKGYGKRTTVILHKDGRAEIGTPPLLGFMNFF